MSSSSSDDQGSSITEKIKCYVRCKPLLQSNESSKPEQSNEYIQISDDKTRITIKGNPNQKILQENTFILDKIFTDEADQETIFNEIVKCFFILIYKFTYFILCSKMYFLHK